MKILPPLDQFICDTCGEIIKEPREGWLEWIFDMRTKKAHSFRVCHHKSYSTRASPEGCYLHGGKPGRSDSHLDYILEHRMAQLLHFIDVGNYHEPGFTGPHVADLREWTELTRRLTLPYYEQARLYWNRAQLDGYFQDANEILVYTDEFLKGLIMKYASEEG